MERVMAVLAEEPGLAVVLAVLGGAGILALTLALRDRRWLRDWARRLEAEAPRHGLALRGAAGGVWSVSGSAAGQAWRATLEPAAPPPRGGARKRTRARTRLTLQAPRAAPGRFLLVMPLPPGATFPLAPPGAGPLGALGRWAVEAGLDVYVADAFGDQHRALVNVEGATPLSGPARHQGLATDAALAARLLDEAGWRLAAALGDEAGLLVTAEGLTIHLPALPDAAGLAALAGRAAQLAGRAR